MTTLTRFQELFLIFAVMEQKMTLYHGSNVKVEKPEILVMGFYKDFGYGFYCTSFEKQAQKWALTKRGNNVVSTSSNTSNCILYNKSIGNHYF